MLTLNRRHKAGLFLALVATALSLLMEASVKQTTGILILGIAVAWLIGSLSLRTLGIVRCLIVCALGVFIAVLPVKDEWERYQVTSQDYDFAVSELRKALAGPPSFISVDGKKKVVDIPHSTQRWEKPVAPLVPIPIPKGATIGDVYEQFQRPAPAPYHTTIHFDGELSDKDIVEIVAYFQSNILRPRPTFSLRAAARAHPRAVLLGLALAAGGLLGSLWMILRALRGRREGAPASG